MPDMGGVVIEAHTQQTQVCHHQLWRMRDIKNAQKSTLTRHSGENLVFVYILLRWIIPTAQLGY